MSERRRAVEVLADSLRERILDGTFAPGRPLREEWIADSWNASRHTVRSALAVLAGERLVVSEPYRGVRVTVFDDDQVRALQDLRRALESEAVRLVAARGDTVNGVAAVTAALDELELVERSGAEWTAIERAHAAVHLAIVEAADSPRIADAYRGLGLELALLLLYTRADYEGSDLAGAHREYVAALDRDGADAVRAHLAESTAHLLRRSDR